MKDTYIERYQSAFCTASKLWQAHASRILTVAHVITVTTSLEICTNNYIYTVLIVYKYTEMEETFCPI